MTKTKILRAAKSLFAKNGYDGTSISDVLKKTQISKGALYHHFPSKEELFIETLIFSFEEHGFPLECDVSSIKSKTQFKKHLLDMGYQMIDFQIKYPEVMSLKWELMTQLKKNASLRKSARKITDTKMSQMQQLIVKGVELGVFPKSANIKLLMLKYVLPLHTIGLHIAFDDAPLDYHMYWKETVEAL